MLLTATVIFAVAGVITAILNAMAKCPQWVPPLLVSIAVLLMVLPK